MTLHTGRHATSAATPSTGLSGISPSRLEWMLRVSVAMTFIGHGAFGFVFKKGWLPFYQVLGFGPDAAQYLMPLTGIMDCTMGVLALVLPIRAAFLHLSIWGVFTALLRVPAMAIAPQAQYSWFEVAERAGNYVPAMIMVLLVGIVGNRGFIRGLFERVSVVSVSEKQAQQIMWMLRIGVALLLVGHAGYGLVIEKTMLMKHYASVGLTASVVDPRTLVMSIGAFEFLLAGLVLAWPSNRLLWFVVAWKAVTELGYVTAGVPYDIFEWIERGGSYLAPAMLIYMQRQCATSAVHTAPGFVVSPVLSRGATDAV